jgi:hypothetical protein
MDVIVVRRVGVTWGMGAAHTNAPMDARTCTRVRAGAGLALQSSDDMADLAAARSAFELAVELKPDYHTAILNLAGFHAKQVRTDLLSQRVFFLLSAGFAVSCSGRRSLCSTSNDRAGRGRCRRVRSASQTGQTRAGRGSLADIDEARRLYGQAIEMTPDRFDVYWDAGLNMHQASCALG